MRLTYFIFFISNTFLSQSIEKLNDSIINLSSGYVERIYDFKSEYVDNRNVDIWFPENFSKGKKYDILIMHDGQNLFDRTKTWNKQEWKVDEWASKLIFDETVRPFIVIGIHSLAEQRWSEYFPEKAFYIEKNKFQSDLKTPKLKADKYLRFIVYELIPLIKQKYNLYNNDIKIISGGSSMGGLISMYAVFEYPKVFDGAICMSTHWPGEIVNRNQFLSKSIFKYMYNNIPASSDKKFYFDYGNKGLDVYYPQYSKTVDSIFLNNGYSIINYKNIFFENELHNEDAWSKRLNIPLQFIFN